jgi:hypothetical protein
VLSSLLHVGVQIKLIISDNALPSDMSSSLDTRLQWRMPKALIHDACAHMCTLLRTSQFGKTAAINCNIRDIITPLFKEPLNCSKYIPEMRSAFHRSQSQARGTESVHSWPLQPDIEQAGNVPTPASSNIYCHSTSRLQLLGSGRITESCDLVYLPMFRQRRWSQGQQGWLQGLHQGGPGHPLGKRRL